MFLNGAILGLPRSEIDARMATIIGFAGLEELIDRPVKTYSSGMLMRLRSRSPSTSNPTC